jgi:hypothetical protein
MLAIGTAAAVGLILVVAVVSMLLTIVQSGNVAALEEHARKSAKATKAIEEELAALREAVQALQPPAPARAEPRPGNIDSADPARDCVIRSGDKSGVARCMGLGTPGE